MDKPIEPIICIDVKIAEVLAMAVMILKDMLNKLVTLIKPQHYILPNALSFNIWPSRCLRILGFVQD
jgi:hypothetical protein